MVAHVSDDWTRLAQAVRKRREQLGLTQTEAVNRSEGGLSLATWRNIETGARPRYRRAGLLAVCRVLNWTPDSIDRILNGDDPAEDVGPGQDAPSVEERLERIQADLAWIRKQLAGGESRSA